jgi:uncharacterized protein (TIGR01777 family)
MKPEAFPTPTLLPSAQRRTIIIAGASGLIGTAFTDSAIEAGHTVRHLVRRTPAAQHEFVWNPAQHTIDPEALEGVDVVLNLSGASISKMPWTKSYKAVLRSSRLDATSTLVNAMRSMDAAPSLFLSGSAVGIYGSVADGETIHDDHTGDGFLATLCKDWEAAAKEAEPATTVTLLRTGLVLSQDGGMLPVVTRIAKLGGAGKLGNGQQHWPWISVNDYCLALLHLVQSPLSGPVNMTAPVSSTAAEFMRTLAAVVHRPYLLPAPAFALKALLGEAADELLLSNQPVHPSQLLSSGFSFSDTNLRSVLTRLLS